ncbi:HAD family hydrolase [Roseovarius aestuarii]|uniref:phosphoglycolate phosphatase n=1 Tax=Roseovarius aestuarii TaxID=475083 RepID=A0A1X7BN00_9RHOB|nr:HAD family hydrolase [Roseovarius aestuarii]SMC10995.1 Phosphoglycolate phosphatase [Roseovarius aestuarii]
MATKVDGLLFDKDGTLFDFHATWSVWAASIIDELAAGDADKIARLAAALDYDLDKQEFAPTSVVIAEPTRKLAESIVVVLGEGSVSEIEHFLMMTASEVPQTQSLPLAPFLTDLASRGLALGVMTNDNEFAARAHLKSVGVEDHFNFIAGFDSGFGAKPEPGPLLAFAKATGLAADRVAMVGDSTHDLIAGRAAGMQTIGVLTGLALSDELAPYADIILPDIGHIPAWLTR